MRRAGLALRGSEAGAAPPERGRLREQGRVNKCSLRYGTLVPTNEGKNIKIILNTERAHTKRRAGVFYRWSRPLFLTRVDLSDPHLKKILL